MFAVPTKMLRYFQVASHINTYFWTPHLKPTASLSFWPTAWFSSITCWKYTPLLRNATYSHVKTAGKHLSNRLINFCIVFAFTKTKHWRQLPSVLWRCWLGGRKGIQPVKNEWWGAGMVICMERGADLHMAQLMPLPLTVSCFSKIQVGFTSLVLAHPGSPGQRAVKRVCVYKNNSSNVIRNHQHTDRHLVTAVQLTTA